jgi:hypothetical protein
VRYADREDRSIRCTLYAANPVAASAQP